MSTNEHVDNAVDWMDGGDHQPTEYALRHAQIEATLAVAHEAKTANLIALAQLNHDFGHAEVAYSIGAHAKSRL